MGTFLQLSPFLRLFGGGFRKLLSMLCTDFSSLINPLVALHFHRASMRRSSCLFRLRVVIPWSKTPALQLSRGSVDPFSNTYRLALVRFMVIFMYAWSTAHGPRSFRCVLRHG